MFAVLSSGIPKISKNLNVTCRVLSEITALAVLCYVNKGRVMFLFTCFKYASKRFSESEFFKLKVHSELSSVFHVQLCL